MTHIHLSEVKHLRVNYLAKDTTLIVPVLRGEKHDIALKILHLESLELAQQAATLAKLRALAIAPRPSQHVCLPFLARL